MMNNNIPQGYKESPLGVIPQDWEVRRLGEIGAIVSGLTYSPNDITTDDNGVLVLRSSNIQNKQLAFEDNVYVSVEKYNPVKVNDILICVRNGSRNLIGKNALITKDIEGVAFGAFMSIFRSVYNNYLIHVFDTDSFNRNVHKNLGATINSINGSDLKDFKLAIPPLAEQERIAEVLGTWDEAIDKQSRLVKALERRKRALMQQLLTARKRLSNFSAPWQEVELGELLDYEQPTKYLVKSTEYDNSYTTPVLTAGKTFILGYTDEEFGVCEKLPVILFDDFTTASKFVGFKFKVKSSAAKLLYAKGDYDIYFVFEAMQNIRYIVGGHERHWISKFAYITILIPTIEEQKAIAQILTTADKEIELDTKKLETLRTQKRALMQQLLTGKKRLKI